MRSHFVGIPELDRASEITVVVDVMRAFTVAAWAFTRGAERIVLADSLEDALALKAAHPDWLSLKDGAPATGFDTVNSPGLVAGLDLTDRTFVQRTTAGTVGAHAARGAALVLCASFVVAGATARLLRERGAEEVAFVVTGDDGRAEEDLACAQYIADRARGGQPDATPYLRRAAESAAAADLTEGVRRGYLGVHPDDVELCLELDRFGFAMAAAQEDGLLVLRRLDVAKSPCATADEPTTVPR